MHLSVCSQLSLRDGANCLSPCRLRNHRSAAAPATASTAGCRGSAGNASLNLRSAAAPRRLFQDIIIPAESNSEACELWGRKLEKCSCWKGLQRPHVRGGHGGADGRQQICAMGACRAVMVCCRSAPCAAMPCKPVLWVHAELWFAVGACIAAPCRAVPCRAARGCVQALPGPSPHGGSTGGSVLSIPSPPGSGLQFSRRLLSFGFGVLLVFFKIIDLSFIFF